VTIQLTGDGSASVDQPSLVFTPSNWAVPQTVNVTALRAPAKAAGVSAAAASVIRHRVSSADSHYNGLAIGDVSVTILDSGTATGSTIFLPLVLR
jgi:hypothetical protein